MSRGFWVHVFKLAYALSLHNTLAYLQIPCSLYSRQNKRGMHLDRTQTHIYFNYDIIYIQYYRIIHKALLI